MPENTFTPLIVGIGARTPLGHSMPAVSAAVRARLQGFDSCEGITRCDDGSPVTLARVEGFAEDDRPDERMSSLALDAVEEALAPVESCAFDMTENISVSLSLPPDRPGFEEDIRADLVQSIFDGFPFPVDEARRELIFSGHEGGIHAINRAAEQIEKGEIEICLVGGVESYINPETVDWIESEGRLKGGATTDGFIPGEGSGFLLMCSDQFAEEWGLEAFASVIRGSRHIEPRPWDGGRPSLHQGLTNALHSLFNNPRFGTDRVETAYGDLNGEPWRAEEWTASQIRTGDRYLDPLAIKHPADSFGDVGAATGTLLAGLAAHELRRSSTLAGPILLFASSDKRPFRSACALRRKDRT